jgi:hypothetical protein
MSHQPNHITKMDGSIKDGLSRTNGWLIEWTDKFQLEVRENTVVIFFFASKFTDPPKSKRGPKIKNVCSTLKQWVCRRRPTEKERNHAKKKRFSLPFPVSKHIIYIYICMCVCVFENPVYALGEFPSQMLASSLIVTKVPADSRIIPVIFCTALQIVLETPIIFQFTIN